VKAYINGKEINFRSRRRFWRRPRRTDLHPHALRPSMHQPHTGHLPGLPHRDAQERIAGTQLVTSAIPRSRTGWRWRPVPRSSVRASAFRWNSFSRTITRTAPAA
jgi:hypothetical protein